jgi:3-mercaptopyruvate sulfurtransferase SseA
MSEKCTARTDTARELRKLGYTNVSEYAGGKMDWKRAGLPLEKSEDAFHASSENAMWRSRSIDRTGSYG